MVGVPEPLRQGLRRYRERLCREAGGAQGSRYMTGLILRPHQTRQGIYDLPVWAPAPPPSRRARHEAVLEAGWDAASLLPHHRAVLAPTPRGCGRAVFSLDGPEAPQERGGKIGGVPLAGAHGAPRLGP